MTITELLCKTLRLDSHTPIKHDPLFTTRRMSSRDINRLVISFLRTYYTLPSLLFTNSFLPQSHILSPTALRDSIWNFKPVSINGIRSVIRSMGLASLEHIYPKSKSSAPIQTAMLPASYQVESKTKAILKDSRIIISPFCPPPQVPEVIFHNKNESPSWKCFCA